MNQEPGLFSTFQANIKKIVSSVKGCSASIPPLDLEQAMQSVLGFEKEQGDRNKGPRYLGNAKDSVFAPGARLFLERLPFALFRKDEERKVMKEKAPFELALSDTLDQAIIAAVRKDIKLLRGIYREAQLQDFGPIMGKILFPPEIPLIYATPYIQNKTQGKLRAIEVIVGLEAHSSTERRARLCALIVKRLWNARADQSSDEASAPLSLQSAQTISRSDPEHALRWSLP